MGGSDRRRKNEAWRIYCTTAIFVDVFFEPSITRTFDSAPKEQHGIEYNVHFKRHDWLYAALYSCMSGVGDVVCVENINVYYDISYNLDFLCKRS